MRKKFTEEKGESSCYEEVASGSSIGENDRDKRANRVHHPVLSQRCPVPIDQRKWNDILAVNNVIKGFLSWRVSKINGATDWNSLLITLCRDFEKEHDGRSSNQKLL